VTRKDPIRVARAAVTDSKPHFDPQLKIQHLRIREPHQQ
jgi:hypothetical protein